MKLKLRTTEAPSVARESRLAGPDAPRVAVIDDEPGNVAALQSLLQGEYQVAAFTDPLHALAYLRHNPVDVVLTDQRMPGLLGTDLLVRLKELGQQPVSVIVTGYTDVKDLVFCINEGLLHRYVLKPWSPEDVRAAVEQGVRNTRQAQALARLVPRQVLRRVFPGGIEHLAPGHHQHLACAVMFADLRGFSALAESLDGDDAYSLLAQYFGIVTPIVAEHGGFVDKFLGDGVLAIFDAPGTYPQQALACAREIDRAVRNFTGIVRGGSVRAGSWRVGIGIASGTVTLGTIGCPDRVEITVLGDTVNTAARLEETCKRLGTNILVQTALADPAPDDFRPLGLVPLRGKERLVSIGELVDTTRPDLASASEVAAVAQCQAQGDLAGSLERLRALVHAYPTDRTLQGVRDLWEARAREH
jgi:class 3 adenylate cyclase